MVSQNLSQVCQDGTNTSLGCILYDTGAGTGSLFSAIDTPLGTILIVIGLAVGVVAIFGAIAKSIGDKI